MKKWKSFISMLCFTTLIGCSITGCSDQGKDTPTGKEVSGTENAQTETPVSKKSDDSETIEITIGAMNVKNSEDEEIWPTKVVDEIQKNLISN